MPQPKRKNRQSNAPQVKDDGTRWVVVGVDGRQIYPGRGVTRGQAEFLSGGLLQENRLVQVL